MNLLCLPALGAGGFFEVHARAEVERLPWATHQTLSFCFSSVTSEDPTQSFTDPSDYQVFKLFEEKKRANFKLSCSNYGDVLNHQTPK
jgi:hypothetical protein